MMMGMIKYLLLFLTLYYYIWGTQFQESLAILTMGMIQIIKPSLSHKRTLFME